MNWKDWFYFTKKEKIGIITLLVCIVVVFSVKLFVSHPDKRSESKSSFQKNTEKTSTFDKQVNEPDKPANERAVYHLHSFDPNIADSAVLVGLGLRPYIARNIIKYRKKGGKFRKPDDFSRIYGLTPEKYEELKPYIRIDAAQFLTPSETFRKKEIFPAKSQPVKDSLLDTLSLRPAVSIKYSKQEKYPLGTQVDIAVADTSELKKIPGIGSSYANRIIKYRQLLGGYYSVEQLREVYGISPELYESIFPWLKIETLQITPLLVNTLSLDRLRAHPYLNFYQARVIVELRRKKGKLSDMSDLQLFDEFSSSDFHRLKPYLSFD